VAFVGEKAHEFFGAFAGLPLSLHYSASIRQHDDLDAQKQAFLQEFEKKRQQELHVGMTLVGPHRDDIQINVSEKAAREFASVGQSALAACAMRLAE
jgi:DNA replication and repair protein RecF